MSQSCPIAFREIDGTLSRLNALSVSLLLIAFLFTHKVWLLYFIGGDFVIRVYGNKNFSPFNNLSRLIQKIFTLESDMVDAGAKRVASQLGIFFIFLLLICSYFGWFFAADVITVIFLICTVLEFVFAFCVACELYFLLQRFR